MKKANRIILGIVSSIVTFSLFSFNYTTKKAEVINAVEENYDQITLGAYNEVTGKLESSSGTEFNKYSSINVSLASEISGNEIIILPKVEGYEEVENASGIYSKVINISTPKTAKQIATEFISEITFRNCGNQMASIALTADNIFNKVAYFSNNDHYYMYIKDVNFNTSWVDAYEGAKNLSYMGRQGYLATVTSLDEDIFISTITQSINKSNEIVKEVGWLGGTILSHNDLDQTDQYYDSFNTSEEGVNYSSTMAGRNWEWACGPEIGEPFFDVPFLPNHISKIPEEAKQGQGTDEEKVRAYQSDIYERNINSGYYFNWNYIHDEVENIEPNEKWEPCLATLIGGTGYMTREEGYSWNNLSNKGYGSQSWFSKGYVVEFGDRSIGDSNDPKSTSFVTAIADLHTHPASWTAWTNPNSLPTTPGEYYLDCDVTLTSSWVVPQGEVTLCLNGHIINGNGADFSAIKINNGATLNLTDCKNNPHYFDYDESTKTYSLAANQSQATANELDGGLITGFNVTSENGGAIIIASGGELVFVNGCIGGNSAVNGGAIYNEGDLTILNGEIKYNNATNGGGVYHASNNNIKVGANAKIESNSNNLYLSTGKLVDVLDGTNAPSSMSIGVTLEEVLGNIVESYLDCNEFLEYFFSDNPDLCAIVADGSDGIYHLKTQQLFSVTTLKPYSFDDGINGFLIFYNLDMTTPYIEPTINYVGGTKIIVAITTNAGYMLDFDSLVCSSTDVTFEELNEYRVLSSDYCIYVFEVITPFEDVTFDCEFIEFVEPVYNEISGLNSEYEFEYGENLVFGATAIEGDVNYKFFDENNVKLDGCPTDVGIYYVLAISEDTENYTARYVYFSLEIIKGTNEITNLTISDVEQGTVPSPSATAKFGVIIYTYSTEENGTYTSDIPTEAGTYWVKATVYGTVNYDTVNETASFKITEKVAPTLLSISIASNLNRTFEYGSDFVKETVTATYSDSSTVDVTGDAIFTGYDAMTPGTQTISVSYGGMTISYTITVAEQVNPTPSPTPEGGETGGEQKVTDLLWLIIVLSVLDLLGVGGVIYFIKSTKDQEKENKDTKPTKKTTKLNTIAIGGLIFITWQFVTVIVLGVILLGLIAANIVFFLKYKDAKKDK